jgi:hypothetical protein
MRLLFLLFCLGCFISAFSQNVGIGTSTPTEKLHVEGNINLAGNLRVNDAAGQPGQVLATNSNGNTQWIDMESYKNYVYLISSAGNWTVPAGVTKIKLQLWGGGGGGNKDAGGGSGGYITATVTVNPGDVIAYQNGAGGLGSTSTGENGGVSTCTVGSISFIAYGGGGATSSGFNVTFGDGGLYDVGNAGSFRSWFGIAGEPGKSNKLQYFQSSATDFVRITSGGDGGNSPLVPNTGGKGRTLVVNASTLSSIFSDSNSQGRRPGGGGAAGFDNGGSIGFGSAAGNGALLIHY